MTNTETQHIQEVKFSDGSKKNIAISYSSKEKYITLKNTNSSAYSKNDYVLEQYRFYNYSQSVLFSNGDNHKDYLLNASILLNYAIEEFKLGWKNDSYDKKVLIERYYNLLIKKTDKIAVYNTLPEHAMLKKTCKDVLTNVTFYIDEIIKKMIYFSIYNIKNDGTFLPIEIVKKTLKTFDCYENFKHAGGTANLNNVVLDGLFFEYVTDNMNNFVDEIAKKIDIDTGLFYELKKDFTKPLRIIENVYDGENKYNLDLKFFYDTTITEGSVNSGLKNLINKFNDFARDYKDELDKGGKSLTQTKIDELQGRTLKLIISDSSESATFIQGLINSNSADADNLALKILLQFHNKVGEEFAVKTFETFETFREIVSDTDGVEQAYDKIYDDLSSISSDNGRYISESKFLYEFKEIIEKLYKTLIPALFKKQKQEGGTSFRLSDAFPSEYDILANTDLDINYYKKLEETYKTAKEDYARLYRVDPKSKEAEEILKKVCSSEYSQESVSGVSFLNNDPAFSISNYDSILYRYLYYAVFEPEVYSDNYPMPSYVDSNKKHRKFRDREEVIKYLSNYDSEINQVAGINKDEKISTDKEFYETVKFILIKNTVRIDSPLSILSDIAEMDFRQFAESKRNTEERIREKETPKVEFVEILPKGFDPKYKILVEKGEDSDKLKGLLVEWDSYLVEYEGIIGSKNKDEREKFEKSFLSHWEVLRDDYLLKGEVIKKQPIRDDKSTFIKRLSFFYIYSDINKIVKTDLSIYETLEKIESIDKHDRRKQTGANAVTTYSNGNGRILIDGKNYDVIQLHTLFKKLAIVVLENTEIDVGENQRILEADKLKKEQKDKYNEYLTQIKNRVSLEEKFFFLEDMLKKKTIPTIPAIDIEFRDEYVDEKGEEKTNWVSVSRMRSDKTNSNLVDKTSVSVNRLYGYNYFENMTLEDTGGKKEISLTLKGIEDLNLEKIIYNSLTRPVEKFNKTFWKEDDTKNADTIQKINDYRVSNFRVRFGYNDTTYGNSAINETNINNINFSNRIRNDKPVVKSPWLYFLINKLETNFVDGETTFEVGGVNIGSYVLENYRIYNPDPKGGSFSFNDITAIGAIGKIANMFFRASNKTICVLSNESDKIIVNSEYDTEDKTYKHEYATIKFKGNKKGVFKESDFEFQGFSMETKDTSNFTIEPGEKEEDDGSKERNLPTAQQVLDALIKFLPTKLYIAPTYRGNESFMAMPVEKTFDNMVKSLAKELRISYDIVEAETKIDSNITGFKDGEWKRRSFIRLYYKGPISRDEEKEEKIRFYKYRGGNESVVKSVSIQNPLDLQKISGVVCGFQNSSKARIFMSQVGVSPENIGGVGSKVEIPMDETETIGPMFVPLGGTTTTNTDGDEAISNISKIANSLTDYTYTGNMEILGDPYYIFDDYLEPFRHKIYLKVNRYKNINLQELADGNYDYYSGLYVVKNITHKLDSGGSFTTNLGLMKFTMASNNKENEQGNKEE